MNIESSMISLSFIAHMSVTTTKIEKNRDISKVTNILRFADVFGNDASCKLASSDMKNIFECCFTYKKECFLVIFY